MFMNGEREKKLKKKKDFSFLVKVTNHFVSKQRSIQVIHHITSLLFLINFLEVTNIY
jgi:hypothetical protein